MRVLSSKTLHIAAYPNGACAGLAESITSKALISSRGVLNSAPMSNPMVREIAFCKASEELQTLDYSPVLGFLLAV